MGNAIFYRNKQYPSAGSGGSGGGGSGYSETVLWDTKGSTSRWADPVIANLSANISDYDEIVVLMCHQGETSHFYIRFLTSDIPTDYSDYYFVATGYYSGWAKVTSDTQVEMYTSTGVPVEFEKIKGIKY